MRLKFLTRPLTAMLLALSMLGVVLGVAGAASPPGDGLRAAIQTPHASKKDGAKPTVVLVHGAFADSSGWSDVAGRLMNAGYPVIAFSNPLRGPASDAAYLRTFLSTIEGPIVLVGHSYGGVVITNAATGNENVQSLVYVAAYAPAEGESVSDANHLGNGHSVVTDHLVVRPFPGASGGDADAYIDPVWFPELFAQDLPRKTAEFMAATQRPGAFAALVSPSGPPAWAEIPSWYMVASQDRIIPPEAERAMAERAGSTVVEIDSSHVVMMSHPSAVTRLIQEAAQ